jgi:glycosyltransferase involved in cell wall biosynthesis
MNQTAPDITVVIPLFNGIDSVVRAVDSVLSQQYRACEIVIVDYGSTDGGPVRVEKERGQHIRIIRQMNRGLSNARNRGAKEAHSPFIAFLDVEDIWEPHYLNEIVKLIEYYPDAGSFATGYQYITRSEEYRDPNICSSTAAASTMMLNNYFDVCAKGCSPFVVSSFCMRKELFEVLGGFDETQKFKEEAALFAWVAFKSSIAYSSSVLAFYSLDSNSRTQHEYIPDSECRFSKRVHSWALNEVEDKNVRLSMIDFTTSHLYQLVSMNMRLGRFQAASNILSDLRCKQKLAKFLWWRLKCWLGKKQILKRSMLWA